MRLPTPLPWHHRTPGPIGLVVVAIVVLGGGTSALAASLTGLKGHGFAAQATGHQCQCGKACRGPACCCDHAERFTRPSRRVSPGPSAAVGPYLSVAPCGGAAPTTASPAPRAADSAALAAREAVAPATSGERLMPCALDLAREVPPALLVEPPEPGDRA